MLSIVLDRVAGPPDALLPAARTPLCAVTPELLEYLATRTEATAALLCLLNMRPTEPNYKRLHDFVMGHTHGCLRQWATLFLHQMELAYSVLPQKDANEATAQLLELEQHTQSQLDRDTAHQQFYKKIVNHLMEKQEYALALSTAEDYLTGGAPDALLEQLLQPTSPSSTITGGAGVGAENDKTYLYIRRFNDKSKAAEYVLRYMKKWDLPICVDLLQMCQYSLKPEEKWCAEVSDALNEMKLYKAILGVHPHWKDWRQLDQVCRNEPAQLVRELLQLNQHGLARNICQCFHVPNIKTEIEQSSILHKLLDMHDTSAALVDLCKMGQDSIGVVFSLLEQVSHLVSTNLQTRMQTFLFLVHFLISNMRLYLDSETVDNLIRRELGLKTLLSLSPELQQLYERLADHPELIVESMIMEQHTEQLSVVFTTIPKLRDDSLLVQYGAKALEMSRSANTDTISEDSPGPATVPLLCQYPIEEARRQHEFPSCPDINLAKALFDLCENQLLVANTCLQAVSKIAQNLKETETRAEEAIDVIRNVLRYAKVIFQKELSSSGSNAAQQQQVSTEAQAPPGGGGSTTAEASKGIALCDNFLSLSEVFAMLLLNRCCFNFSLQDLIEPDKARQLRDKLIASDRLKLAIDVASRCGVSAGKASARMGLSLLRLGRYKEAREKFSSCLVSAAARDASALVLSTVDEVGTKETVTRIIEGCTVAT
eukprot:TRINITY_DN1087_c0_g1_i19.p2 TRINITY_DN1087_c0_g1~~TRINITY_DN1087_c0_g1_i19.p2  ORF type:complete len:712 (+),score=181.94 TRINITY_DN1087_c0_g1_i19:3005-5140(+)